MSAVTIESKSEDYNTKIVSLRHIAVDNFATVMDSFPVGHDVDATIVAARATMTELHGLWHMPDAEWRKVRENVSIGIIKETKHYGNTSVSMGWAVRYFSQAPSETKVTFLNCGSGGIKYQHYRNENGIIYVAFESKPKDGASPNAMELCGFKPAPGKKAIEKFHNRTLLNYEMFNYRMKMNEKYEHVPNINNDVFSEHHGEVFAFITGSVRGFWEKQDVSTKQLMENEMREYFDTTTSGSAGIRIYPINDGTFFISQEEEGQLEALGTSRMYENLRVACLIDSRSCIVGVFGKGQGSAQKVFQSPDGKDFANCNFPVGMSKPTELEKLPWSTIPAMKEKICSIAEWSAKCGRPVIALKSGCVLYLDSKEGAVSRALFLTKQVSNESLWRERHARVDVFRREINQLLEEYTAKMSRALEPSAIRIVEEGNVIVHDGRAAAASGQVSDAFSK